jgi:hypothetical protein
MLIANYLTRNYQIEDKMFITSLFLWFLRLTQVIQIQPAGKNGFEDVADGCFIPYDYDGPLLHDV